MRLTSVFARALADRARRPSRALLIRIAAAGASSAAVLGPAVAQSDSSGEAMYLQHCAVCHQPDGKGIPGFIPPLAGNTTVTAEGEAEVQEYLSRIIFGYHGGLIVDGQMYAGRMPPIGYRGRIDDTELLALINYQRAAWGNHAREITFPELAKARAAGTR